MKQVGRAEDNAVALPTALAELPSAAQCAGWQVLSAAGGIVGWVGAMSRRPDLLGALYIGSGTFPACGLLIANLQTIWWRALQSNSDASKKWGLLDFKQDALATYIETCQALAAGDLSALRQVGLLVTAGHCWSLRPACSKSVCATGFLVLICLSAPSLSCMAVMCAVVSSGVCTLL